MKGTSKPKVADVGIYTENGKITTTEHSVTVNSVGKNNNVIDVISKGGIDSKKSLPPGPGNNSAWSLNKNSKLKYYSKKVKQ